MLRCCRASMRAPLDMLAFKPLAGARACSMRFVVDLMRRYSLDTAVRATSPTLQHGRSLRARAQATSQEADADSLAETLPSSAIGRVMSSQANHYRVRLEAGSAAQVRRALGCSAC